MKLAPKPPPFVIEPLSARPIDDEVETVSAWESREPSPRPAALGPQILAALKRAADLAATEDTRVEPIRPENSILWGVKR